MLALFGVKSSLICRNLHLFSVDTCKCSIRKVLRPATGPPFSASAQLRQAQFSPVYIDIKLRATLDLSVSIALIFPVSISTTWMKR